MDTAEITLRPPDDLVERYNRLAEITGTTRASLMLEALEHCIDGLEYEHGLIKKVEDYRARRLETATLDELRESLGLGDEDILVSVGMTAEDTQAIARACVSGDSSMRGPSSVSPGSPLEEEARNDPGVPNKQEPPQFEGCGGSIR